MRIIPNSYGATRQASLLEYNPCHEPGGSSKGGQFAPKGVCGTVPPGWKVEQNAGGRWEVTDPEGWKAAVDSPEDVRRHIAQSLQAKHVAAGLNRAAAQRRLQGAEDQPLPYDPPLGGRPPDDPLAAEAEHRDKLKSAKVSDQETLGGGITGSYKVTLEDGTEGVWKPDSEAPWTDKELNEREGEDGDGEEFSLDENAQMEHVDEAVQEAWTRAQADYTVEVKNAFVQAEAVYHEVIEEYSRAGKLEINPGDDVAYGGWQRAALINAFMGSPDDPGSGVFSEEGLLLGEGTARAAIMEALDELIEAGVKAVPQEIRTPRNQIILERSKYFNDDNGLDNWRDAGEAEAIIQDAADSFERRAREEWEDERENRESEYIRGSITNRDFPHSEREAAAYELDRLIGINTTPVTVVRESGTPDHRGDQGSVQAFVTIPRNERVHGLSGVGDDQLARAALLDMLIGNTDRHGGNYFTQRNRIHTIDNGLAFPSSTGELRSEIVSHVMSRGINLSEDTRRRLAHSFSRVDWNAWAATTSMSRDEREAFLERINVVGDVLAGTIPLATGARQLQSHWW